MFIYIDISMFIASKSFTTGLLNFLTFNLIFIFYQRFNAENATPAINIYLGSTLDTGGTD